MRRVAIAAVASLATLAPASAQDFADRLHEALAPWRAASWYARTGNAALAAVEAEDFRARWQALSKDFPAAPPPYAGDAQWGETFAVVDGFAAGAARALDGDDAAAGTKLLDGIAEALARLRRRHGVADFADGVAAYREAVDRIAGLVRPEDTVDDERRARLGRAARALEASFEDLEPAAPAKWAESAEFKAALVRNRESVAALAAAVRRPDASALEIVGLIRVVRSNYALLFLRYGALPSGAA